MNKIILTIVFLFLTGSCYSQVKKTKVSAKKNKEEVMKDQSMMNIFQQDGFDIHEFKVMPIKQINDSIASFKKEDVSYTIYSRQLFYKNDTIVSGKIKMTIANALATERVGHKLLACSRTLVPNKDGNYMIDLYWIE